MDYDTTNVKNGYILLKREGGIFVEWLNIVMGNSVLNYITQIFDAVTLVEIISNKKINRISIQELQNFLDDIKKIDNCPHNLLTALAESLNNLIPNFGKRSEQYLNLAKENLLKKNIFTEDIKDLIEVTYYIFQETLTKLESFLLQAQIKLAADIEKILPEILTVLCEKIKEWYNIKVPEYITANLPPKDITDSKVLRDITVNVNIDSSSNSIKILLSNPCKRKEVDGNIKNDNNKVLKLLAEKEIDNFLNIIYEELPVIGEDSSYSL
ncbi:hypothetical protein [Rickettsia endosymbiont of Polydrusus tereticollis]|uniref:hypothetical protein n=1 Tax=Rickettsia endosymbiont of Polydrusus tereticollis TaxID=3066251 RepID=UPI0031334CBE